MAKTGSLPPGMNTKGLSELWARLRFLLLAAIVYRIGIRVPIPGMDPDRVADFFNQQQDTILGMFNMFSGGAMEQMSILALGIMPYISASIIVQIMSAVVPTLEQLKKEGEAGRRKINQYTRYLTVLLATVQGIGFSVAFSGQAYNPNFGFFFVAVVSLITGAVFMMWLGEQVTERGIGNGISMLIFFGIVAGLPPAIGAALQSAKDGTLNTLVMIAIFVLMIAVVWFVVKIERGQRRITVNYAKRQQGRKQFAAQTSHLPLKVNMAGVIPAIFASSLLLFPATLTSWFGQGSEGAVSDILNEIALALSQGSPLYVLVFSGLIIFFCFFYTALMFNPNDVADNLKRSGAFIPGIRPGEQSARYIDNVMTRLTVIGSLYMVGICLMPQFLMDYANVPFYLGGTSLLIVVVVVMDFMSQVQSHLMSQQYESLMKKANLRSYGSGAR